MLVRRGGHPLLDKLYNDAVSYLSDPAAVCDRIKSHSGESVHHRQQKGWGYEAAGPPDFKGAP